MASAALTILRHRFGASSTYGASHIYDVAFWVDCPEALVARRPVRVTLPSGAQVASLDATTVPDATEDETADVAVGAVLEFVVAEAGGQISDHLTTEELEAALMAVHQEIADAVDALADSYTTSPKAVVVGVRIGTDGKFEALPKNTKDQIDAKAKTANATRAVENAAGLAEAVAEAAVRKTGAQVALAAAQADSKPQALITELAAEVDRATARATAVAVDKVVADAEAAAALDAAAGGAADVRPLAGRGK